MLNSLKNIDANKKNLGYLKNIINKLKSKSVYQNTFLFDGRRVTNTMTIANKFNEYFIAIGSDLADAIDTSGKPIFSSYLRNASVTNFTFTYTNSDEVLTLINDLKPKHSPGHGPLARYVKLWVAHAPGMPGTFFPPAWVSDPDMHHGTCVTHVPWCMPGSLTSGFLWSWWRGKRSRHSRRMRNPQFYVSGKRPMTKYRRSCSKILALWLLLPFPW